jgi:hypothetical protein
MGASRLGLHPGMTLRSAHLLPSAARRFEGFMRDHHARFLKRKLSIATSG